VTSIPQNPPIAQRARGIDHVGLTVPDIQEAERFLIDGLGAEFLYETLSDRDPPLGGPEVERLVRLPAKTQINVIRMYKMGTGPGIELFQYTTDEQRPPARGCDFGWQHVALYVDDMEATAARAVAAGAERLNPAWSLMNSESGDRSAFCFLSMPFGGLLELITYPSAQLYESTTPLRRWKPPPNA
jgi:catechol 2,3-dioxygenase-like lactoylglutathione lyase family enzyme